MASKSKARMLMKDGGAILREAFQEGLSDIGIEIISQVIARARRLNPSERYRAITEKVSWPGENAYRQRVVELLAALSFDAVGTARAEVPKAKKIKLSEELDSIKLAQTVLLDKLPKALQDKIRKRAELLVGAQLSSLQQTIFFQYNNSFESTEDLSVIEDDLKEATIEFLGGPSISAGAEITSSYMVNESRSAFFMDSDVLEEVDAFEFVNGDPVTPICQDLNGTIFAKDDPNMFRYTPPLHWNCKSYIQPVLKGNLKGREIEKLKPSTKKLDDSIQFAEHLKHAHQFVCAACGS